MNKIRLLFGKKRYKICFLLDNVKKYVMLKAHDCKDGIQKMGAQGIVEIDNQLKIILGPNSKQLKKYMADLK